MADFERFDVSLQSPCNDSPLPNQQCVRLLRRLPPSGHGAQLPNFSLAILDLTGEPATAYRALSYTWGPPMSTNNFAETHNTEAKIIVTLDEEKQYIVPISSNLHDALECIAPIRHGSPVWIDALCINQLDPIERNVQVQRMGEIYSKASEVVGWLGQGFRETDELLWTHRQFYKRLVSWRRLPQLPDSRSTTPSLSAAQMDMIAAFYSHRRYWKRVWIIQEIVLAQRATVAYGPELLYMQSFLTIADHVRTSNMFWTAVRTRRDPFTGEHTGNGAELLRISERIHWLRATRLQSSRFDQMLKALYGDFAAKDRVYACLAWLLSTTRIFEATDPRDKVYSLIGLLDNFCDDLQDIKADYSKTAETVFYETTVMLLEHLPNLNILSQREDRPRLESSELPSWVPNFATTNVSHELVLRHSTTTTTTNTNTNTTASIPPFDVFANSPPPTHPSPRPLSIHTNELHLTGIPLSTISTCGTLVPASISIQIDYSHQQLSTAAFLLRACKIIGPTYNASTSTSTATACADTITTHQLTHSLPSPLSRARCFSAWIGVVLTALGPTWARNAGRPEAEALCRELDMLHTELIDNGTLPWLREDLARVKEEIASRSERKRPKGKSKGTRIQEPSVTLDRSGQLVQHMHKHTAVSKPFLTASGRLGMCPRSAVPGDEVWLVRGARVPFVLRQVPGVRIGAYRLIGEAYVEGVMFGEAMAGRGMAEGSEVVIV